MIRFTSNPVITLLLIFICALKHENALINISVGKDFTISDEELKDCYSKSDPTLTGLTQHVYMSVSIMDIDRINENDMEFEMHSYITATWLNPLVSISIPNNASKPLVLHPKLSSCLWMPDIIFPNTKEIKSFTNTLPNIGYKYMPSGYLYRSERLLMRISCAMDFHIYPLDSQHCNFRISLMTSPDDVVVLHWSDEIDKKLIGLFFVEKLHPFQFRVLDPVMHKKTDSWYTGNYTELWANITFHRRLTGSLLNAYFPSTLVVALSWLSFWIDVEAVPGRVTLGVTSLLTISTLMIQSRNGLPPVQYVTALDIWLFACLTSVFASLIEYGAAYSYRFTFKNIKIKVQPVPSVGKPIGKIQEVKMPSTQNKLDLHSRWFFPSALSFFAIIYWIYFLCKTEINMS